MPLPGLFAFRAVVLAMVAVSAALLSTAARAKSEERLPFIGDWSGGPATCKEPFRFTPSTYIVPSGFAATYESIERSDTGFSLKFSDGYRVFLTEVNPQGMRWHSPRSGDTFDLRRCPRAPTTVRPLPARPRFWPRQWHGSGALSCG